MFLSPLQVTETMIYLSVIYGLVFINFTIAFKLTGSKNTRIVGGTPAENENYFVSIRLKSLEQKVFGSGHLCGGTLVHDGSAVLTAAHCLFRSVHGKLSRFMPEELITVMGSNKRNDSTDATIQQVMKIDMHENYTNTFTKNQNDLAVLWLNETVLNQSSKLQVLDLIDRSVLPDELCKISGFGRSHWVRKRK